MIQISFSSRGGDVTDGRVPDDEDDHVEHSRYPRVGLSRFDRAKRLTKTEVPED